MIKNNDGKIWAFLLHVSFNMWEDCLNPEYPYRRYEPFLRVDELLWNDAIDALVKAGANMLVLDLGDGIQYKRHPEIAVKGAWTVDRLESEIKRLRSLGIEPIPKLDFSSSHDTWMGEWSHMVSTPEYYSFCRDMIDEVSDIFGHPRFFHIGMDEESVRYQNAHQYVVQRLNGEWWDDFFHLKECVDSNGSRAWIWPDYMLWNQYFVFNRPGQFFEKMPKDVVQSNWYYSEEFDPINQNIQGYLDLDAHRFDQIPTGSFHRDNAANFGNTVDFCSKHISNEHLLGFMQTVWMPTTEDYRWRIMESISLLSKAREKHYKRCSNKKQSK